MKEEKKKKGSVLIAESAYNSQNEQFVLVMINLYRQASKNLAWISSLNHTTL